MVKKIVNQYLKQNRQLLIIKNKTETPDSRRRKQIPSFHLAEFNRLFSKDTTLHSTHSLPITCYFTREIRDYSASINTV